MPIPSVAEKACRQCGSPIAPERVWRNRRIEFCSQGCSKAWWRERKAALEGKHYERDSEDHARPCANCGEVITSERVLRQPRIKFCSKACQAEHAARRHAEVNERLRFDISLSTGTAGALSELIVSADLLARGYEVFRALSPSCSCDLIIFRDGRQHRVEVRTGSLTLSGSRSFPFSERDKGRSDIAAVVYCRHEIIYYDSKTLQECSL
jgi:hypothetical protein